MNEIDIRNMLDGLAEQIRIGKKPLIGTGRIIDDNQCLILIEQIKTALPKDLSEARVILQERDQLIGEAQEQAAQIISQAQADANKMLNESDILQQAQAQANQLVSNAQGYANKLIDQSYQSIAEVMNAAEGNLKATLDDMTASKFELYKLMNGKKQR